MSYVEGNQNAQTGFRSRTENNQYLNPLSKSNAIYFRDTIKQFCPHQRYVDHRPYPYRSFVRPPIDFNYYNNPTEKDSFIPCYKNYPKRELNPLVSRQDLAKYLRSNGNLYMHKKPCNSCSRINDGNYGRNYYTCYQKTFPFINGNFRGENFMYTSSNGFKKPFSQTRNYGNTRYNSGNYNRNNDNFDNNNYGTYNENDKNDLNNQGFIENDKNNNEVDNLSKDNNKPNNTIETSHPVTIDNKFNQYNISSSYRPKIRRRFHKTQIFNNYKPFMVDDFKEYADYE